MEEVARHRPGRSYYKIGPILWYWTAGNRWIRIGHLLVSWTKTLNRSSSDRESEPKPYGELVAIQEAPHRGAGRANVGRPSRYF